MPRLCAVMRARGAMARVRCVRGADFRYRLIFHDFRSRLLLLCRACFACYYASLNTMPRLSLFRRYDAVAMLRLRFDITLLPTTPTPPCFACRCRSLMPFQCRR